MCKGCFGIPMAQLKTSQANTTLVRYCTIELKNHVYTRQIFFPRNNSLKESDTNNCQSGQGCDGRIRPQIELIPREALHNALVAVGSDGDLDQGELISRSPAGVTLSDCKEEDQDDGESEKGKQQSNLSQDPFLRHRSRPPQPQRPQSLSPLPRSAQRSKDPPLTTFCPTERFFTSRHIKLSSPSYLLHPTSIAASSSSSSCSLSYLPIGNTR
ncbi:hypothetical protein GW17_00040523 [Ensete ventricosum]|nr:hypothetical protein GW17_00040523 [Ensete ventricosum]